MSVWSPPSSANSTEPCWQTHTPQHFHTVFYAHSNPPLARECVWGSSQTKCDFTPWSANVVCFLLEKVQALEHDVALCAGTACCLWWAWAWVLMWAAEREGRPSLNAFVLVWKLWHVFSFWKKLLQKLPVRHRCRRSQCSLAQEAISPGRYLAGILSGNSQTSE